MKIAQLIPPWLPVPPQGYGGLERVAFYLTEALVARGHEVTLFASGDSKTSARLFATYKNSLGNAGELKKNLFYLFNQANDCFRRYKEFEVIHNHLAYAGCYLAELVPTPTVHTLHGTIAAQEVPEEKREVLRRFKHQNFVSISDNQRHGIPELNFVATVYNGIPLEEFNFSEKKGDYLCWLGRITWKKGLDVAIRVAQEMDLPLKIAAFVDPIDRPYFEEKIKPFIDGKKIQMVGELAQKERSAFLGEALAFLFPISWHEPFGLVMIEAMSCGTPVVAYARGSVPEIIEDGQTGFLINPNEEETYGHFLVQKTGILGMIEGVQKLLKSSSEEYGKMAYACRKKVESHFSVEKMVEGYEKVYQKICG